MRYANQTTQLVNPAPLEPNEVFCNDGTKDITNGKKPACINNGGVKMSSGAVSITNEKFLQKHKNHLIIAVVLVAGYFAYKKFKK